MYQIAILAGGLATRLRPITNSIPKSMIDICGKPFAHWQMKLLEKAGYTDVVYCVGYKSDVIKDFLGSGIKYNLKITYSHDGETQLGTGGAIFKALPLLGEKFSVIYGDSYLPIDFGKVEDTFSRSEKLAQMTIYSNKEALDTNNIVFQNGDVVRYQKGTFSKDMTHIDFGFNCFDRLSFSRYPANLSFDLGEICCDLARKKMLAGYEVFERFYEVGSPQGLIDFSTYVERNIDELQ
jgi:NDP-sugar pyrophosphorylase family protein